MAGAWQFGELPQHLLQRLLQHLLKHLLQGLLLERLLQHLLQHLLKHLLQPCFLVSLPVTGPLRVVAECTSARASRVHGCHGQTTDTSG